MSILKLTGESIKQTRIEKGMTMKEFGKLFNPPASDSIVSRWERGISEPNAERMKKIKEIQEDNLSMYSTEELVDELNKRGFTIEDK